MLKRASVIVKNSDKVILVHRIKPDEEYYAVPGGGIEEGETPLQAAYREIDEELGLKLKLVTEIHSQITPDRADYWFLAETDDTEFIVTGPEKKHLNDPTNLFDPQWVDKNNLNSNLPIYPLPAKDLFAKYTDLI